MTLLNLDETILALSWSECSNLKFLTLNFFIILRIQIYLTHFWLRHLLWLLYWLCIAIFTTARETTCWQFFCFFEVLCCPGKLLNIELLLFDLIKNCPHIFVFNLIAHFFLKQIQLLHDLFLSLIHSTFGGV